jgi:hypothetical protein
MNMSTLVLRPRMMSAELTATSLDDYITPSTGKYLLCKVLRCAFYRDEDRSRVNRGQLNQLNQLITYLIT